MTVRRNVTFLTPAELESTVRAFVMMNAGIVDPQRCRPTRCSRWDEYVAIHRMIQNANAPGVGAPVNFGDGAAGARRGRR